MNEGEHVMYMQHCGHALCRHVPKNRLQGEGGWNAGPYMSCHVMLCYVF